MPVSSLPADQVAVLELVLERGRTYDEIADLLGIDPHAVRARAHAAIDALGPQNGSARRLTTARRGELADYLLGQQDDAAAEATRNHLAGSSGSRAWARVVASELKPLGGEKLPVIPDEGKASAAPTKAQKLPRVKPAAEAPVEEEPADDDGDDGGGDDAPGRPSLPAPSSRLGGALLIAGVLLIVLVLLVVIVKPFGGDDNGGDDAKVSKTASTSTTPAAAPQVIGQVNLTGSGKAVGIAQIVQQANTKALVIAGQNLPTDKDTAYAVWLYNSPTDTTRLGYAQPSQKAGRLEAIAPLPANSARFKELVISAENRQQATQAGGGAKTPSKIVLRGRLDKPTAPPPSNGSSGGGSSSP